MKNIRQLLIGGLLVLQAFSVWAVDEVSNKALTSLQSQWAIANYELNGKPQNQAFLELLERANALVEAESDNAQLLIWRGIISSTYAGVKGGIGALKYAKAAKSDLERALKIDAEALQGSAYTSLGTLYFNVPGWPIGFGDDKKAQQYLETALSINPDGIDPNYFYADFWRDQKNYEKSKQYFLRALDAAARPGRELADKGRRAEITQALVELEKR